MLLWYQYLYYHIDFMYLMTQCDTQVSKIYKIYIHTIYSPFTHLLLIYYHLFYYLFLQLHSKSSNLYNNHSHCKYSLSSQTTPSNIKQLSMLNTHIYIYSMYSMYFCMKLYCLPSRKKWTLDLWSQIFGGHSIKESYG